MFLGQLFCIKNYFCGRIIPYCFYKGQKSMGKYNKVLLKETGYISFVALGLSAIFQAIFLVLGKWDYTVFLGNLLSAGAMILNFFFMGISIEKALRLGEKDTKKIMWASQSIRNILLFAVIAIGAALPIFNTVAVIVPLFFPRIALFLRPYFDISPK